MRFNRLTAAALLAIMFCPATMADTTKAAAPAAGAETTSKNFVQSFYKWYLTDPRSDRACKKRGSDFNPALLKLLNDDFAASQKNKDEVVGLDFDPILDTNAEPFAKYTATKVTKKGDNYWVQVDGSGGNRKDKVRIEPEVSCKDGKCQFVNFHYTENKPPDDNLVSILKALAKDRK